MRNYDMIEKVIKNQTRNQSTLQDEQFLQQQAIQRSFDGVELVNRSQQIMPTEIFAQKLSQIQKKFMKSLHCLINKQNNQQLATGSNQYPVVMPYQNQCLFVISFLNQPDYLDSFYSSPIPKHPKISISKSNLKQKSFFKQPSQLNPYQTQSRRLQNNMRIHHSFDSKLNFLQMPEQAMPAYFQQPRQPLLDQFQNAGFHSQFISPFASMLPIINSQSVDPLMRKTFVNSSLDRFLGNSSIGLVSGIEENKHKPADVNKPINSPAAPRSPIRQPEKPERRQSPPNEEGQKWISFKQTEKARKSAADENEDEFINPESESCSKVKKHILKKKRIIKKENVDSESYQVERYRKSGKQSKKLNDTKNITKNFSKAIISFILQNKDVTMQVLGSDQEKYEEFATSLKKRKNTMTNIKQLRELWTDSLEDKTMKEQNRAFRIIRNLSACYIYNSRISNTQWHLKYRQNLLRAIKEPDNFKYIKDI